jgi:predicted nucleotidyltransferase
MEIEALIGRIIEAVRTVAGVEAVVLGGSRAQGTHAPDSDIDIGIYYDEMAFDLESLEAVARALDDSAHGDNDRQSNLVSAPGMWGPWVNGGGWLTIDGQRVDFILRDFERVRVVVQESHMGIVSANYQPGHPHAYVSSMYAGELAICQLLWERTDRVSALQRKARDFSDALQAALAIVFGFEMNFSCELAEQYVSKDEHYYVMAHIVRSISCMNQMLFALNKQYCLNEKRAVKIIEGFRYKPANYKARVDAIVAGGGNLAEACAQLRGLVTETQAMMDVAISGENYLEE